MNTVNEDRNYLNVAIESYLNQNGIEIELIISTVENDVNIDYIKENYPKCVIVEIPLENHPISKGIKSPLGSFLQLNHALKYMTGDWFTFASGNDFAYPYKCALEVESAKKADKLICYSAFNHVNSDGFFTRGASFHSYDREKHQKGNFVSDCAMIHKSIVDKYLPFRTELNNYAYWDLWLRVYEGEGNVFVYNSVPTWGYRQNQNSMHLERARNAEKIRLAEIDRDIMLSLHPL